MARSAEAFRPLAHDLHADESLVQERRSRSGLREVAVGADRADQDRGVRARLDLDQGASGWDGRSKKNGPQAIGKSRGGWNTKVHLVAANARTAITLRPVARPCARCSRRSRPAGGTGAYAG